jgi:hypothetical protein
MSASGSRRCVPSRARLSVALDQRVEAIYVRRHDYQTQQDVADHQRPASSWRWAASKGWRPSRSDDSWPALKGVQPRYAAAGWELHSRATTCAEVLRPKAFGNTWNAGIFLVLDLGTV